MGLRIVSGYTPVSGINLDADVDGDSQIGMEEILYLFKIIGASNRKESIVSLNEL